MTTLLVQGMAPSGDVTRIIANALVGATLVLALRAGDVRPAWLRAATLAPPRSSWRRRSRPRPAASTNCRHAA